MVDTTLKIDDSNPIGTISPRLYGQFAEHLGRCCYDGIWVGTQSDIPNQGGLRTDVVNALKNMPVPLLRWPGGCYADHYHWKDGIGPAEKRPRRLGMSCGITVEDDNSLGTHEFIALCRMLGAEPYLAGNVGTGTPQELSDWLEYCNASIETNLTRERRANGSAEPFNVPLWGIGNENWGCGGNFDAVTYAQEYRRYATMMRHIDANAEFVICGFDDEWNFETLQTLSRFIGPNRHMRMIDHLSIHRYWVKGGPELDFTEQDYYNLLAEAQETEAFVQRSAEIVKDAVGEGSFIGIALDEWGVWHPENRLFGPGEVERRPLSDNYEQAGTMRDALTAAIAFEGFHRQCNVLTMANLAQVVNVIHATVMTKGADMWLTPTYFVFQMHKPHIGAQALPVHVEHGGSLPDGSSAVSATASKHNGQIAVTLTNRHYSQGAQVRLSPTNGGSVSGQLLAASSPREQNSASDPERIKLQPLSVDAYPEGTIIELPPHSIATVVFSA